LVVHPTLFHHPITQKFTMVYKVQISNSCSTHVAFSSLPVHVLVHLIQNQ
jgi:hypothetical protein